MVRKIAFMGPRPVNFFKENKQTSNDLYALHYRPERQRELSTSVAKTDNIEHYNKWLSNVSSAIQHNKPIELDNSPYSQIFKSVRFNIMKELQDNKTVDVHVGNTPGVETIAGLAALDIKRDLVSGYTLNVTAHPAYDTNNQRYQAGFKNKDYEVEFTKATGQKRVINNSEQYRASNLINSKADNKFEHYWNKDIMKTYSEATTFINDWKTNTQARMEQAEARARVAAHHRTTLVSHVDTLYAVSDGYIYHNDPTSLATKTALYQGKNVKIINTDALQVKFAESYGAKPTESAIQSEMFGFTQELKSEFYDKQTGAYDYYKDYHINNPKNPKGEWHYRNEVLTEKQREAYLVERGNKPRPDYKYFSKYSMFHDTSVSYDNSRPALYVTGSKSRSNISDDLKAHLDRAMESGMDILLTDTSGIDRRVQEYLKIKNYDNVKIYTVNTEVKNQLYSNWEVRHIPLPDDDIDKWIIKDKNQPLRKAYNVRDYYMANDATEAYVVWGTDQVTGAARSRTFEEPQMNAASRMLGMRKPTTVEFLDLDIVVQCQTDGDFRRRIEDPFVKEKLKANIPVLRAEKRDIVINNVYAELSAEDLDLDVDILDHTDFDFENEVTNEI